MAGVLWFLVTGLAFVLGCGFVVVCMVVGLLMVLVPAIKGGR